MKSGIYKIFNHITEKFYIGSAVNLKARWTQHKSKLNLNKHPNKFLQASWNLHSEEAFEFIILEYCERELLFEREQYWLDSTDCCNRNVGYNLFPIAGSALGTKWTEKRKIEARERMLKFRHTEASKVKMSEVKRNQDAEVGRKISASKIGHSVSQETRLKIKTANKHLGTLEFKEKQKAAVSKPDKWPHGYKCKCRECLDKKNEYNRNYRKAIKEASNVQFV